MTDVPPSFPVEGRLFEGDREVRFFAVALETLVQDVSPVGDGDVAGALGEYSLGEGAPPADTPEYVTLEDGIVTLENPPFLLAEFELAVADDGFEIGCAFDSELKLLIDPPVEVTIEGESFEDALAAFEQMVAEIYRTRGRRLEMIDEGVVDPAEFSERR